MRFLTPERDAKIPMRKKAAAMKSHPCTTAPRPEEVEMPSFPPVVSWCSVMPIQPTLAQMAAMAHKTITIERGGFIVSAVQSHGLLKAELCTVGVAPLLQGWFFIQAAMLFTVASSMPMNPW